MGFARLGKPLLFAALIGLGLWFLQDFFRSDHERIRRFLADCAERASLEQGVPPLEKLFQAKRVERCVSEMISLRLIASELTRSDIEKQFSRAQLVDYMKVLFGKVDWIRFQVSTSDISLIKQSFQVELEVSARWKQGEKFYREALEGTVSIEQHEGDFLVNNVSLQRPEEES